MSMTGLPSFSASAGLIVCSGRLPDRRAFHRSPPCTRPVVPAFGNPVSKKTNRLSLNNKELCVVMKTADGGVQSRVASRAPPTPCEAQAPIRPD